MIRIRALISLCERGIAKMKPEVSESTKHVVDALSVVTVLGTLVELLPSIAALFTIIWTAIRIWETETVQKIVQKVVQKLPLRKKDAVQE